MVSFRHQPSPLLVQARECPLEPADITRSQLRLFAIDMAPDCGVSLGIVADRPVMLQLCRHQQGFSLDGIDLVGQPEDPSMYPFHARSRVFRWAAYPSDPRTIVNRPE
jgi:hypothetical protein